MKKEVKQKQKMSKSAIILIIGIIIILIPCTILAYFLGSAYLTNNKPNNGERFLNDLEPAITDKNVSSIKSQIESLTNVQEVTVIVQNGQMRIYVDTNDDLDVESIKEITGKVYDIVNDVTPINTYFNSTSSRKMYDLSIHTYNTLNEDWICYEYTKNAMKDEPILQLVSEPVDPELAKELTENNGEASE